MLLFASSERVEHVVRERVVYLLSDAPTSSAARARMPPAEPVASRVDNSSHLDLFPPAVTLRAGDGDKVTGCLQLIRGNKHSKTGDAASGGDLRI